MKENAALVLISLSIVVVSVTKTATSKEALPVASRELSFAPKRHVVEIKGFKFDMADIEVQEGDTVQWVNKDIVPHTATANDENWDSDLLEQDATWEFVVKRGIENEYFCRYHPTMKGTIVVE